MCKSILNSSSRKVCIQLASLVFAFACVGWRLIFLAASVTVSVILIAASGNVCPCSSLSKCTIYFSL